MQIVDSLVISKKSKPSNEGHKNGRRIHRKGKRSEEEQRLIDSLIKENNSIYKNAKARGRALPEEKARCREIRELLIMMKAI